MSRTFYKINKEIKKYEKKTVYSCGLMRKSILALCRNILFFFMNRKLKNEGKGRSIFGDFI